MTVRRVIVAEYRQLTQNSDAGCIGGHQNHRLLRVARRIDAVQDGKLVFQLLVKEIGPADPAASKSFKLKGHEWERAFTAEVR